jgi:large subunit ribosomal protein L2
MAMRFYKPLTPGARFRTNVKFKATKKKLFESYETHVQTSTQDQTSSRPKKGLLHPFQPKLIFSKTWSAGRNNKGRITVRGRCGSGHRRKYRNVSFKRVIPETCSTRPKRGEAIVVSHDYDPNRNARISLLKDLATHEQFYIIKPAALKIGTRVLSTEAPDLGIGKAVKLHELPLGTIIHNIEAHQYAGGQFVRAAGAFGKILGTTATQEYTIVRLPSKEVRLFPRSCAATIGQVGNLDMWKISRGKAGRSRWLCRRPRVRGSAKNATDHPHGGGEGKTCIGRAKPVTPWGKGTLGDITRKRTNPTTKYILQNVRKYRMRKRGN